MTWGNLPGGSQVGRSLGRISIVAFLSEYFPSIIFKESKGKTFPFFRFKPYSQKNFLTFFFFCSIAVTFPEQSQNTDYLEYLLKFATLCFYHNMKKFQNTNYYQVRILK